MVESGPAAGVIAASPPRRGRSASRDVISFDMGGTTAKAGLVRTARRRSPRSTRSARRGSARRRAGTRRRLPDPHAGHRPRRDRRRRRLHRLGRLRRRAARRAASAGADPGPACYGRGGTEPTVTDANLVLGRLNPDYFLGGEHGARRRARAKRAIEHALRRAARTRRGRRPRYGIVEIANAAMASALRLVSVQRGYDPREFVLVAFGGAGPVHANRLAAEMGIPTTIVPPSPGHLLGPGPARHRPAHDYSHDDHRTGRPPRRARDSGRLSATRRTRAAASWSEDGLPADDMTFRRQADLRVRRPELRVDRSASGRRLQ